MKKVQNETNELRKKSVKDLHLELKKLQDELVKLRITVSLQKEKNTSAISKLRKQIARVLTLQNETRS